MNPVELSPGTIDHVPVHSLVEHPRNVRIGSVDDIVESLAAHGQYRRLIVQKSTMHVLAGNHTLKAIRRLGWESVAVEILDVDDEQALRILLADNRTSDNATYDYDALGALLAELRDDTADALDGTGWTPDNLDDITACMTPTEPEPEPDHQPIRPPEHPETKPGDTWRLGDHTLICGDASDPDVVERVMDGHRINVAVTSPPYADRRKYDETTAFRPIPPDEYVTWFQPFAENVAGHLTDDGVWIVNIKPGVDGLDTELYVFDLVLTHVREWGWHFATEYTWERNGVPKAPTLRLKNQFEPIYVFARDRWKFRPDHVRHRSDHAIIPIGVGAGDTSWDGNQGSKGFFADHQRRRNGTKETMWTVQGVSKDAGEPGWAYPGNRLPTLAGSHDATGHPAAYPVGLPQFFINLYSDPGDHIFDPFAGSGSTILAAHNTNRIGHAIEISPAYCDVIAQRFERDTGIKPIRET